MKKKTYTVVVAHTQPEARERSGIYSVVVEANDGRDAANNAGLAVIYHHQGEAEPLYAFEHKSGRVCACDNSVFDAESYGERVTFFGVRSVEAVAVC